MVILITVEKPKAAWVWISALDARAGNRVRWRWERGRRRGVFYPEGRKRRYGPGAV